MTYYDAFIAFPGQVDGLGENGRPTNTDVPTSPLFPEGYDAYFAIRDAVKSGRRPGRQIDWGSWAVLMTSREIAEFLDGIFGPPGAYEARYEGGPLHHLADRMRALRAYTAKLPPDEMFAVIGEEF